MKELSLLEQLCFCTTCIITRNQQKQIFSGTGFFYSFLSNEKGEGFIYIVTNRHVCKDMTEISFGISRADANGDPVYACPIQHVITMTKDIIYHPNPDIDLCAIPINIYLNMRHQIGQNFFLRMIDHSLIPTEIQWKSIEPIEEILMIGYPNGLWDEHNNMPIVRRGITATAPYLDYNGKREFLIDAACFPGSSGSPVFLCNNGSYVDKARHSVVIGTRVYFLGIVYKGPIYKIDASFEKNGQRIDSPVNSTVNIPNNLGFVIKANVLDDFLPLIKEYESKLNKSVTSHATK